MHQVATVSLAGSCWQDLVVLISRPGARVPLSAIGHLAALAASITYVRPMVALNAECLL